MADVRSIVVDDSEYELMSPDSSLVSWILDKIRPWEDYRRSNFEKRWQEYYRLWRGIWSSQDKSRESERSKLISPALQQAIEVGVSEIEEAIFGRGLWFDIVDNFGDSETEDIELLKQLLQEDLETEKIKSKISEIILLGALYGTGIGKIVVTSKKENVINREVITDTVQIARRREIEVIKVDLVPIHPEEFVIDPFARNIEEALGCAHITYVPLHTVVQKQRDGVYKKRSLGGAPDDIDLSSKGEVNPSNIQDKTKIIEYHGLVPKTLLEAANNEDFEGFVENIGIEDDELVEAIVTIANDSVLLRAVENKLVMKDRAFIAYQHDTVPNRFWGRGIAEKGYNSQKALDTELRGRVDAMALTIHPMMGVDATRLIKGTSLSVRPGKSILTSGDPATILRPLTFGQVTNSTFAQSGELERMIQMGTGSMDSAAPVGVSPRNSTASGMSMILSGAIKRSKRTLSNIEENFLRPFLQKTAWRYMQFDPERYPIKDAKFLVKSTLGIMARELEQNQLANMLKTVPPDSPAYWMLIRNMYELSNLDNRDQMIKITEQMLQKTLQPDPAAQQATQLELAAKQKEIQELDSKIMLNVAKAKATLKNNQDNSVALAQLDAQLRSSIAQLDNDTKIKVALINAEKERDIEKMKAQLSFIKENENKEEEKEQPKSRNISIKRENGRISGISVEEKQ